MRPYKYYVKQNFYRNSLMPKRPLRPFNFYQLKKYPEALKSIMKTKTSEDGPPSFYNNEILKLVANNWKSMT